MAYNQATQRGFEQPTCAGAATGPDWVRGEAGSRDRGTWVQFDVQVSENGGAIRSVRFLAFGCPHVIAVCQRVAEQAVGLAVAPRLPEGVQELRGRFGVPVEKIGRLLIVEDAWVAAQRAILQRNA